VLREFLRTAIFERFPLVAGICVGFAQGLLLAWTLVLFAGPVALAPFPLLAVTAALVALHAWGVPRAGKARLPGATARALLQIYLGISFSTILIAAAVAAVAVVVAIGASLVGAAAAGAGSALPLFGSASLAVAAVASAALAWGFFGEPRRLSITQVRVELRGLDPALRGLRVAHLSYLHIGNGLEGARLERVVATVNGLAPDLIALTGDLFDHDPAALTEGAQALGRLTAPLGVYAVLGNHDLFTGSEAVAAALARHAPRLRLLRGECVTAPTVAPFYVAGVDDPGHDWTAHGGLLPALDKVAATAPSDGPVLLLVHRPDAFPQAASLGFALVLAGHFHGGQIAMPGFASRWNAASVLSPYHRGLHRLGDAVLYVSRGLGFAGARIRLASPPEIAVLELATAAEE
jgi:predicted MPP superfamily phosphohydrolase